MKDSGSAEGPTLIPLPLRMAVGRLSPGRVMLLAAVVVSGFVACGWWTLETRTLPFATGDKAADFSLLNHDGTTVESALLRQKGPLVTVFYRGHW